MARRIVKYVSNLDLCESIVVLVEQMNSLMAVNLSITPQLGDYLTVQQNDIENVQLQRKLLDAMHFLHWLGNGLTTASNAL